MTIIVSALLALQAVTLPVDTAAVVTAAITRAQSEYGVEVTGAAFEVRRRIPQSGRSESVRLEAQTALASRFGMTAVAQREAVQCDPLTPGQTRECRLTRSKVFVGVLVQSVSPDRAVVAVEVVTPHGQGLFSRSVVYELARTDDRWAVTKVLSQGAS